MWEQRPTVPPVENSIAAVESRNAIVQATSPWVAANRRYSCLGVDVWLMVAQFKARLYLLFHFFNTVISHSNNCVTPLFSTGRAHLTNSNLSLIRSDIIEYRLKKKIYCSVRLLRFSEFSQFHWPLDFFNPILYLYSKKNEISFFLILGYLHDYI